MGLGNFFRRKASKPAAAVSQETLDSSRNTSAVAAALDQLGYFSHADPADREQIQLQIAKALVEDHYLPFIEGPGPDYRELDPRHYRLDGEDLYEEGGVVEALENMAPFFKKLGVKMAISAHSEEYDIENQLLNHEITINGKKYVLFKDFEGYGWGEAAQRFADMVNDQLNLQGSDERLYLINGDNDGRAIFLTDALYILVTRHVKDSAERPLKTAEWCQVQQVQYVPVT